MKPAFTSYHVAATRSSQLFQPPTRCTPAQPNGFALFSVLVAILLLTGLSSVTILRANTNTSTAYIGTLRQHAFFSAERQLWLTVKAANIAALQSLPLHTTTTDNTVSDATKTQTTIFRADSTLYWIVAKATISRGRQTASHRVAISARLTSIAPDTTTILVPLSPYAWLDLY